MDIRDLSVTQLSAALDELLAVCRPGGPVSKKCPALAADATRKANALKGILLRLSQQLQEAGPPPRPPRERQPLYLRLAEHAELRAIASLVGHLGVPEDDLYALTKSLAGQYGSERVTEAMAELIWVERETRRARLRPEVIRVCRPLIGPAPGADDFDQWWAGKGGTPEARPAQQEKPQAAGKPARKRPAKRN